MTPEFEPYTISDERLAEIRGLIEHDEIDGVWLAEGTTNANCAGAIFDLLSERDDARRICECGHPMFEHDQYGCIVANCCERKGATVDA
jgi:hypothetical protein